jgi:hypothetical protein
VRRHARGVCACGMTYGDKLNPLWHPHSPTKMGTKFASNETPVSGLDRNRRSPARAPTRKPAALADQALRAYLLWRIPQSTHISEAQPGLDRLGFENRGYAPVNSYRLRRLPPDHTGAYGPYGTESALRARSGKSAWYVCGELGHYQTASFFFLLPTYVFTCWEFNSEFRVVDVTIKKEIDGP